MKDTEQSLVDANQVSAQIDAAVGNVATTLLGFPTIHEKPELAFEEYFACELLAQTLRDHDLEVETGVYSLETAFTTTINSDRAGPVVALLAEYDALPRSGHGHKYYDVGARATLALNAVAASLPGV